MFDDQRVSASGSRWKDVKDMTDGWQDWLFAEAANEMHLQIAGQLQEGRGRFPCVVNGFISFPYTSWSSYYVSVIFSSTNTKGWPSC